MTAYADFYCIVIHSWLGSCILKAFTTELSTQRSGHQCKLTLLHQDKTEELQQALEAVQAEMAAQLASVRNSAHTSEQSAREQAQEMLERERTEAIAAQQSWRQQHEELEKVCFCSWCVGDIIDNHKNTADSFL